MPIIFPRKKKLLLLLCAALVTLFLLNFEIRQMVSKVYHYVYPETSINCYRAKENSLPDISEAKPRKGKSIFFHETSCNSYFNGKITIGARQACAVESAARLNPNLDVYLLYASPGQFCFEDTESDRILKALLSYQNVNILHLNLEKYAQGTPVEDLYRRGFVENSLYAQSHASDVLRYLTLWKYGGIYLDLDVVVTKTLENLPPNFAGSESKENVAAGILGFSPGGIGHQLAKTCLDDLHDNFDGFDWGNNGPGVITRLLKSICGAEQAKDMVHKDCQGFTVYPPDKFYAVPWWNWTMYFDESSTKAVSSLSKNSFIIHVWNKHSERTKIPVTTQAPYLLYAKQYCPKVVQECHEYF
ncbi:hypothetical protein NQ315_001707 [Exocentrus adspersus]|uniref:Alpha 1,4-glycosyltransferase domain-containing protein n=1 Tax=Exocentrus adspersus TaxID=1586481 RepID=A0AAV8W995_9CUCU|nr:hypothetical protein NQ315_001707 [Exocentrus adspersus]